MPTATTLVDARTTESTVMHFSFMLTVNISTPTDTALPTTTTPERTAEAAALALLVAEAEETVELARRLAAWVEGRHSRVDVHDQEELVALEGCLPGHGDSSERRGNLHGSSDRRHAGFTAGHPHPERHQANAAAARTCCGRATGTGAHAIWCSGRLEVWVREPDPSADLDVRRGAGDQGSTTVSEPVVLWHLAVEVFHDRVHDA
jgi:hypothetical protein